MSEKKLGVSIFIALLFHVSGLIGILFTPYKNWFIQHTPINLLLMAGLLIWNQSKPNKAFIIFIIVCCLTGMIAEIIGVQTGLLFGDYAYGIVMGPKVYGVPLLIGVNWFVLVFCCMIIMERLHDKVKQKYLENDLGGPSAKLESVSIIVDGALLATTFDWIMEPVAVKLEFWKWQSIAIPVYNYICWFIISCFLIMISRKLLFSKTNDFAVHLLIIQSLFFLTLRIFL